jgi:hypothetical protein
LPSSATTFLFGSLWETPSFNPDSPPKTGETPGAERIMNKGKRSALASISACIEKNFY